MTIDVEALLRRLGIEAKRSGKEWVALCPNPKHEDRKPSWRMRDEPGATKHAYFKCWPCGWGGGAVTLVRDLLGIATAEEAKAWIEGVGAVDQRPVTGVDVELVRSRMRFALPPEVIVEPLEAWPSPPAAYLASRGIEPWQVERWGIGYAIAGRLRGRLIVISRDRAGRPVRYTARTFVDAEKRYLEPQPREGASSTAMFGEEHWPPVGEERDLLFVVEGAVNGLALEAELPGAYFAATAGSSMRGLYGIKLATWKRVCVMTDPDEAGDRLAEEIASSVGRHATISRLRLPEGFDPAKLRALQPNRLGAIVRSWLRECPPPTTSPS